MQRQNQTKPYNTVQSSAPFQETIKRLGYRIANVFFTLLIIAFLTSWGLILAEHGREHLPIQPMQAVWQAVVKVWKYISDHPRFYYWHRDDIPAFELVLSVLKNSAGLLLLSLAAALLFGLPLGIVAARAKQKTSSAIIVLISVLGVSTPSFLFAMFLWVVNIWVHRTFDIAVLPSVGFGWDAHLIMPVLALSMRPLAQIAQITYVSMRDVLQQDFVRTAHSKGLSWSRIQWIHIIPSILIPIFTTLGSSLRYSLASLPIIETFYDWPGVGSMLLDAIPLGNIALIIDLILSLGLFFLLVNLLIEVSFPLLDPRLRNTANLREKDDHGTFVGWILELKNIILAWASDIRQRFSGQPSSLPPLPSNQMKPSLERERPAISRPRGFLREYVTNASLIVGTLLLIALLGVVLFGEKITLVSPYQIHGVRTIDGVIGAPPFQPSSVFPWGTDHVGRDMQALVLAGGKRTLSMAFFAMFVRLILGSFLGILSGWQRGGWFDRLVTSVTNIWAAFPVTLFAIILIQALGIQQGMWVFVVALSVVGWGEVAQFVRGQVISLKPQLFIESARSVGTRSDQILARHILPNLVNSLIVLAALEMGGVLMLLAELGYLNIFMGGGFQMMIGETGRMAPVIAFFSDVPEWAALIANVRQYWRSYPWMALSPGLAVFISIIAFNLFGEGLRRFLDETHANLNRLFNRYSLAGALSLAVMISLVLRASTPLGVYRAEGLKFDEQRVMQDIKTLSDLRMQGRETGMDGANLASLYIAHRMEEIGIFPAGEKNSYYQRLVQPRVHMFEYPTMAIVDDSGQMTLQFTYLKDFREIARYRISEGTTQAPIMGAAYGPDKDQQTKDEFGLSNSEAVDHIVIVRVSDMEKVNSNRVKGVLIIADDNYPIERRELYPYGMAGAAFRPYMLISPDVADALLRTAGSSLAELDAMRESLGPGELKLTKEGTRLDISLRPRFADDYLNEAYINVLGVIPGQGHFIGLEEQVIVVGAYYDGLGTDPAGTVYPGANDNASGVALMLELARLMKESSYQPDKTILFVAWAGGERQEGLSVDNVLNARAGANKMTVETVIELSGVGYGSGEAISIGSDSSYRLVKLFQEASGRYNIPTTTRGRGPHYDLPITSMFGGRDAMTLSLSWDGSDDLAHTPRDVFEIIDPIKLRDVGRSTYLTLLIISRETEY